MLSFVRRNDRKLLAGAVVLGAALALSLALVVADGHGQGRQEGAPFVPINDPAQLRAAGRRAAALVSYRWQGLGYRLSFAPGKRGLRGQTDRDARTITVYLAKNDTPHRVAHDIAHELGHAVDDRLLTPADRRSYLRLRGRPGTAWWPGGKRSDYESGAGDFAEVFALCHAASPEFRSRLAPRPKSPCALLAAAGVTNMEAR